MSYTCNHCGGEFCSAHRLPENHNCGGLTTTIDVGKGTTYRSTSAGTVASGGNASLLWLPIGLVLMALEFLFSGTGIKLLLIVGIALVGASATVGTGIAPLDSGVDDTLDGLSSAVNSTSESNLSESDGFESNLDRGFNESKLERLVHKEVNQARVEKGLPELRYDAELGKISGYHSSHMDNESFFSHTDPNGGTRSDRYDRFGYNCRVDTGNGRYLTGGENIFHTSFEGVSHTEEEIAELTVQSWMESPGHRENLLMKHWRREGIGVSISPDSEGGTEVFVTQNFC